MKKFKIVTSLLILIAFFCLYSCGADEPVDQSLRDLSSNTNPNSNPSNPNTGGTSSGDYWPTALNNQWVFKLEGVTQSPMKMVSLNTISGNAYYTFNQQTAAGGITATNRIRKSNGDYYLKFESISSPAQAGLAGFTMSGYEFILLKDYLAVGGSWTSNYSQTTTFSDPSYPVITINTNVVATVMEKNSSITVGGKNYTDVIKIKFIQSGSGIGTTTVITSYYWFSKNIGPIKIVIETGGQTSTQELVSYIVN